MAQTYAVESQSYVLHCTTVIGEEGIKLMGTGGSPIMGHPIKGSSAVIGPDGRILTAAETNNEELIIADLDMTQIVKAKTFADAAGHCTYPVRTVGSRLTIGTDSRPDMLWLGADPTSKPVVSITNTIRS